MQVSFTKMNGAGNDFVLIDNRDRAISLSPEQIQRLCHRQRGVGADGLFLLVPNETGKADWSWEFFNADGGTADMCGNGARCFAAFTRRVTGGSGGVSFETGAGVIQANFNCKEIMVNLTPPHGLKLDQSMSLPDEPVVVHCLNTGVPHAVLFVENADEAMVTAMGATIRYHDLFAPNGTNVNFAQVLGPSHIRVRTYERGVEGETLACGTGVSAAAMIASKVHGFPSPIRVRVQGGDTLEVSFDSTDDGFENVRLTGPVEFVFDGRIEI